jgi:cleavage and polyadenylation specificity factor subunit 1
VFDELKFECLYHYLDDVVIYSKTFEEHLEHVKIVFERLRAAGLTVKPDKVMFAIKQIFSMVYNVGSEGVRIDPERTQATRNFTTPKDAKGISRFVGMVNFYHKFIPNLAELAAPLNQLRKKCVKNNSALLMS